MKNKRTEMIFLSITLLTLLLTSAFAFSPSTTGKTYNGTIQTFAFLTAAPNPIGVGQQLFLSMWIDKVPNTATGVGGDRWQNLKITVTKPDATTETLGPFTADAAGGAPELYTPTVTGNYTFQMSFPGQTLTGDNGTGVMTTATQFIGDVYGPSTRQTSNSRCSRRTNTSIFRKFSSNRLLATTD